MVSMRFTIKYRIYFRHMKICLRNLRNSSQIHPFRVVNFIRQGLHHMGWELRLVCLLQESLQWSEWTKSVVDTTTKKEMRKVRKVVARDLVRILSLQQERQLGLASPQFLIQNQK